MKIRITYSKHLRRKEFSVAGMHVLPDYHVHGILGFKVLIKTNGGQLQEPRQVPL